MTYFMRSIASFFMLFISFLLISCAGTADMNPMVKEIQNDYRKIVKDSLVVNKSPEELREAQQAVADLRQAVASNKNQQTVRRQALIARQRITIARETAQLKSSQNEIRRASRELQMLLDEAGYEAMEAEEYAKRLINFRAQKSNRGLVLRFKNLEFDSEKASLKSSAERPINELADYLNGYPDRNVLIEGYTDNTGSKNFNQTLSKKRAYTVREALISRGIDGARIEAVGLGEQYPIATNKKDAGRERNRRVEVIISDKTGEIPDRQ